MPYTLTPIHCRPWLLNGISLKLIESHYENNYGTELRRLNAISAQLAALDFETAPASMLAGLKQEELAALNSTLLHELYFASLGGEGKPAADFADAISRDFTSVDRWRAEFTAMARALAGRCGWVVLAYNPRDKRLINQYASEHAPCIVGGLPILALDMYEHAYTLDFGTRAEAYVEAFMRNIDFAAVAQRYEGARSAQPLAPPAQPEFGDLPAVGPEEVAAMLEAGTAQVIDTRARHAFSRTPELMRGAIWRDPERVQEWMQSLARDKPVVTYCAYGFHVGCRTATALRDAGFDAKFMAGGHSAWKAIGGPTAPASL